VASYSVFPNDGIRVKPRLIRKVSNSDGITLWEEPSQVDEVISQQTARTMMTLLRAVTAHGTGAAASQLNHPVGGKTGTTSDYTDAWFLGFSPSVTCGVWVGFDSRESLGEKETGARAALPIWMTFMKQAIVGKDNEDFLGDPGPDKKPILKAQAEPPARPAATPAPANTSSTRRPGGNPVKLSSVPTAPPHNSVSPRTVPLSGLRPAQAIPIESSPKAPPAPLVPRPQASPQTRSAPSPAPHRPTVNP